MVTSELVDILLALRCKTLSLRSGLASMLESVDVGGAAKVCIFRILDAERPLVYPIVERDAALAAAARMVEALLGTVGTGAGFGRERNDGLAVGFEAFGWRGADFEGTERADAAFRELSVPGPLLWAAGFLMSVRGLREVGWEGGLAFWRIESGDFLLRRWRNVSGTSPTVQSSSIIFITRSSVSFADLWYASSASLSILDMPFSSTC